MGEPDGESKRPTAKRSRSRRRTAEHANDALPRANEDLEQQVVTRTRQLKAINEMFMKEVDERERTESLLRKANEKAEMILDSMTDRFYLLDKEWRVTDFNKHAEEQLRTLGKDPSRFIGTVLWDEFPHPPIEEPFRRAMSERVAVTHEHYYAPLGEWVENRIFPSPDGGLAIFQRYVTNRKRAEEELQRKQAYLAEAQRLSHTASWAWNASTHELFWSDEHFRILGLVPSGKTTPLTEGLQCIHPGDRDFVQQAFDRSVREKSDFELDCRIVRADGTIRNIHSIAHPVFDEHGSLTEYVGTIIDVTEQKQTELRLQASERRFRLLLESIPHHVWSFRTDGSVGYWNQQLIDYSGLTTEERQQGGWAALHPDDVERVRAAWREALSKGTPYEQEERLRGRDGRYRRFLCRGVPAPDERRPALEWFGTDTDIEDLRRAQETLVAVQAELAHMARVTAMGELVASIAHEVKQPLTAVVTNGDACVRWLDRDTPNLHEAKQALARIIKEANRASEVINRIRTLVKQSPQERVQVDINRLIQESIALVSGEAIKNQVLLQTELGPDISPVLGDRIQLQQVILNLVMNAIEAISSRSEGPRAILLSSQNQGPAQIVVAVRDSGIGIDPKNLDQIFEPFFTTKPSGMGMGLSISRSLVEAHGGRLWAMANEVGGATLHFSLPATVEA